MRSIHVAASPVVLVFVLVTLAGCKSWSERLAKGIREKKESVQAVVEAGTQLPSIELEERTEVLEDAAASAAALSITNTDELAGHGSIRVWSVEGGTTPRIVTDDQHNAVVTHATSVEIAFANDDEKPIRFEKLEFFAIDREGFAKAATKAPREVTVPPRTKRKVTVEFEQPVATIAKIRVWNLSLGVQKK